MELITTFLIAGALAMDAFSVSIAIGSNLKKIKLSQVLLVAGYFGFFQFFLTVLGWYGGTLFQDFIQNFAHWIAFGLLMLIGGKMILESFESSDEKTFNFSHKMLFVLAIATSIDALAVGVSYAVLNKPLFIASILIGLVAFAFSYAGVYLGKSLQKVLGNKMELLGGIILIGIGIKMLLAG